MIGNGRSSRSAGNRGKPGGVSRIETEDGLPFSESMRRGGNLGERSSKPIGSGGSTPGRVDGWSSKSSGSGGSTRVQCIRRRGDGPSSSKSFGSGGRT